MSYKSKEQQKKYFSDYWHKNKSKLKTQTRNATLGREFGITLEIYNEMLKEQDSCCALCKRHSSLFNNQLSVDHCHETGRIRGLLCVGCNTSIGYLGDTAEALKRVINYLEAINTSV